jgi:hypothetical protein
MKIWHPNIPVPIICQVESVESSLGIFIGCCVSKILFLSRPADNRYRGPDGRAMDEAKIGREETPSGGFLRFRYRKAGYPH